MTERLRSVLDTNVFVSAFLSQNPSSPTKELIERWKSGEFTLLICDALVDEIIEKLVERAIDRQDIVEFVAQLDALAEWIDVPSEAIERAILQDPDDDIILACAVVGKADYLVTYDPHFDALGGTYRGVRITKVLPFLRAVRGDALA